MGTPGLDPGGGGRHSLEIRGRRCDWLVSMRKSARQEVFVRVSDMGVVK